MISALGYKILTKLPVVGQDTIVSLTSLPLSRDVLLDYIVIPDFYVLRLIMEHKVLHHLYATLVIT